MPSMHSTRSQLFTGTSASDNELALTATGVEGFSLFQIMTTAGAVDVEVTLDGSNWSTVVMALEDQGATASTTYVVVTAANRLYQFKGKFAGVRLRQNGATGVTLALLRAGNP